MAGAAAVTTAYTRGRWLPPTGHRRRWPIPANRIDAGSRLSGFDLHRPAGRQPPRATVIGTYGAVNLTCAKLRFLDCSGARPENIAGPALFVDDMRVEDNVFLRDGFTAPGSSERGTIRLAGSRIGGELWLDTDKIRSGAPGAGRWSTSTAPPTQESQNQDHQNTGGVCHALVREYPDDQEMRVSPETIYQALYVQARGTLKREVAAALRSGRTRRKPHSGRGTGSLSGLATPGTACAVALIAPIVRATTDS